MLYSSVCIPDTSTLLTSGGDERIICDPVSGVNKYGCFPRPQSDILAFGSSTASTISESSFLAADALRSRIIDKQSLKVDLDLYHCEFSRIRKELIKLLGIGHIAGFELLFSASGTDAHVLATKFITSKYSSPITTVVIEPSETGSGIPTALEGHVEKGERLANLVYIRCRGDRGEVLEAEKIDWETENLVHSAISKGQFVLLVITDLSKTGLVVPGVEKALNLRNSNLGKVEILIDACQLRLAPESLRNYLENNCMIAITGSKFFTGPAFSGALLIPKHLRSDLKIENKPNFGLLLRWEAALVELRAFMSLPSSQVKNVAQCFAIFIKKRIENSHILWPLEIAKITRGDFTESFQCWDVTPTIFPFVIRDPRLNYKKILDFSGTKKVYETAINTMSNTLEIGRCELGQPVACGIRNEIPQSALRICLSSRLVVEALSAHDGIEKLFSKANLAITRLEQIVTSIF